MINKYGMAQSIKKKSIGKPKRNVANQKKRTKQLNAVRVVLKKLRGEINSEIDS